MLHFRVKVFGPPRQAGPRCAPPAWTLLLACALLSAVFAGCNRAYYRQQADQEVYGLIESGSVDPRWPLDGFTIEPDPTSRLREPHAPDCPPMPPDDPTSHLLMHFVDGKRGWPYERHYGRTEHVENPAWAESLLPYLEFTQEAEGEEATAVLDRQAAVHLALVHSREYQGELEDLYLSALDVSFQRFRFDTQFFGGNSTFFTKSGPLSGSASDSSRLSTTSPIGARRLFATGGQMVAEVANSVVWQFSGSDGYASITPVSLQLVQPLLRGAGRAVVLERLTDSERALLSNIRQLERYRRGFYLNVVTGVSTGPGPSRGGVGLGGVSPGGDSRVGGYLSLLEQQLQIRNQRTNVASLSRSLERLDEYLRTGITNPVQVEQIRQSLYQSQINLLSRGTNYEDQLDAYKITLGLPPSLEVSIEDPVIHPLELIDPALLDTQNDVARMLGPVREMAATAVNAYEATSAAPTADQIAQAAQAFAAAGTQIVGALEAVAARDYAGAVSAADVAVGNIDEGLAAAEAGEAIELTKAGRDVAQAVDEFGKAAAEAQKAAAAGEPVEQDDLLQLGAKVAVQMSKAVARANVRSAGITARVADQGAQAARAVGTSQAAKDASDAAMAAGAAQRRAHLRFFEEATEAAAEADNSAERAASSAAIAARDGEPVQYTNAVERAAKTTLATMDAVRVALRAENTAEVARQADELATALNAAAAAQREMVAAVKAGDFNEAIEAASRAVDAAGAADRAARAVVDAAQVVTLLAERADGAESEELSQAAEAATKAIETATNLSLAADAAVRTSEEGDSAKTDEVLANAEATAEACTQAAETMTQLAAAVTPQAVVVAVEAAEVASQAADSARQAAQTAGVAAQAAKAEVLPDKAREVLQAVVTALMERQRGENVLERTENYLAPVQEDRDRLAAALDARIAQLKELSDRVEFARGDVHPGIADPEALRDRVESVTETVNQLIEYLPQTTKKLREFSREAAQREAAAGDDLEAWRDLLVGLRQLLDELWSDLLELSLARATARLDALTVKSVELQADQALEVARANRRDWMNARAALVDSWRQIEVVANTLESDLDLVFNGDLTTRSDNLSGVHNTTGEIEVGFEFDAPLTRLEERNEYREVLINYQRARRQYYAFEDRVSEALRGTLRSLHLAPLEFELQRAAVHTAINRTIRHQEELEMGRATGPTAARDLSDAFGALLNAQNSLLRIWLEYEIERMSLEFDLGVMPLDEQGTWPLDEQGMWIHSDYLEGDRGAAEPPESPLPAIDLGPPPELPQPTADLINPATALVEPADATDPRQDPQVRPASRHEPFSPGKLRDVPRVHDAHRPRRPKSAPPKKFLRMG